MIAKAPKVVVLATGAVVVFGGAGLAAVGFGGNGGETPARSTLPPATAEIEKATLTETEDVDGTLGFGDAQTVSATGKGTLTWLAPEGSTVSRGEPLYKVDTRPIPLLYGSLPLYRVLKTGVEGSDVLQFERNLRNMGYTGFTVDKEFSSSTADAVKRWQEDLDVEETGTVQPGSVVIASKQVRVAEHKKTKGDSAAGPVFTYTGTNQVVTVDLSVDLQKMAKKGAAVDVEMPGGDSVKGKITKVGKVATKAKEEDEPSTITVTIALRDHKATGGLDQAPVTVGLVADQAEDVLAVPVGALLALSDGGYGVQVVDGGTARTVSVETGMFADGKVEISGQGLKEGMKVGIPK